MILPKLHNGPRLLLAAMALASLALPFAGHAPNRLLSGAPLANPHPLLPAALAGLVALAAFERPRAAVQWRVLAVAAVGVLVACVQAGDLAIALARQSQPAARTLLGAGFWAAVFSLCLVCVDAVQRLRPQPATVLAIAAFLPVCVVGLAVAGRFRALSLAQEAATHGDAFAAALARHVVLVGATVSGALLVGVPLGLAVHRRRAWRGPVFAVLNIVQTVPSVALFGLMIAPLAAIGLSGIGIVPALIALVFYALLPVVRAMVAGLDGVDAATLDAARGLGMAPRRVLLEVELPLAAPALIAGFRIVTVQTIGLAVVAALIGAGGLGDFVFQGLGQYAEDLVLLGALPAIALALAADLLLRVAAAPFQARPA